ncbi:hypothetical protein [Pseudobdellovibrio exovorus]|uniref:Uncharacterized protein n=1 Tax=Pseudobdellovibrio exovorus JSS TaxID=1184267 RepID=M4V7X6_9BACT|nr:hypothetical protein [Pseudobdellovibrio exovorus]AGH95328.1 hypothetical protein A11Q_1112 [Pseudobdellovibrio exovorus JSS]
MSVKMHAMAIGILSLTSMVAHATLNISIPRGEKTVSFRSPRGQNEICVIPKHYPGIQYKNRSLKKEQEFCSYSFYDVNGSEAAAGMNPLAICAKTNSTNPAVNLFEVRAGQSKRSVEAANCAGAKKAGKYKNSTSCSYTPAILAYYHVSQILGGIGRVPTAVLRTMDRNTHLEIAQDGLANTRKGDLINTTWSGLHSILTQGLSSSRKDLIFTQDGQQSYGAFIENPNNEVFYRALFNAGSDRAAAFRDGNAVYRLVRDQRPLSQIVSATWNQENLQKLYAMRDTTEFIVLDHILNQQDRFGNIAAQPRITYFKKNKSGAWKLALESKMEDYTKDLQEGSVDTSRAPITVSSMILKDNDCGVSKTNVVKAAGLLRHVAHMSAETYQKIMQLHGSIQANKAFFTTELLFTERDFQSVSANLTEAVQILKTNCRSGALKLDLNLDEYLSTGRTTAASCE